MKTALFILPWILFLLSACSKVQPKKEVATPNSLIPERREFPLNPAVNPCDDFYAYTCDKVRASFKLREDRRSHTFAFNDSHERILKKKKEFLKDLIKSSKHENERRSQLANIYSSCMNPEARAQEEKSIVESTTKEVLSLTTKKELYQYLTREAMNGEDHLMNFWAVSNLDNSDIHDIYVYPAKTMSLPEQSYYKNKKLIKDFKSNIKEFFTIIGVSNPGAKAQFVIDYETGFANAYPTPTQKRSLYSKKEYLTLEEVQNLGSSFEISPLVKLLPTNLKFRSPMTNVIGYLVKTYGQMSLDNLKALTLYYKVNKAMDMGYPDYFQKKFDLSHKYLGGAAKRKPLDERCTLKIMRSFAKEIDAELFDEFFPNFSKKKFVSLLERVRGSIIDGMKQNTWLSKEAKEAAILKMKTARFQVVKPDNEREWDFNPVADYSPTNYYSNLKLLEKNKFLKMLKEAPLKVNKDRWSFGPMTVNAYYSPSSNKFVMPAGILQYPFYDADLPDHVNLGAIGAVVGHELGHGIDDKGSKYDHLGRVKTWMTEADLNEFRVRSERLIKQFDDIGHNGKLTLGENIGDLVGVTFALNALKKTTPLEGNELKYKEFFTQWGRSWCGVIRPEEAKRQLKTGPHSAKRARVNEQMKHQGDFHKVYQCNVNNKLYLAPEDRVSIW